VRNDSSTSLVQAWQPGTPTPVAAWALPALLESSGDKIRQLVIEFLGASIENDNTRAAYMRALTRFCDFIAREGLTRVQDIRPLDVAAYLRSLKHAGTAVPTQKQHMAAIRGLFDYLVSRGALDANVALSVKAPKQSVTKGKTPILTADEAGEMLRSIETSTITGLRDRALIGLMAFTFARVSAACAIDVGDVFHQHRRVWVRLHEKNDKVHDMPCHHTLEHYLTEYIDAAGLNADPKAPLFQALQHRPYGRGPEVLSGKRLSRVKAWEMVQRRAQAAHMQTDVCNHTFRGTGITAYLENGGTLEKARQMAAHASTRTTQLYDRREDRVTLDEVVKINIRG
jgi:site-specific recombinase XerD